MKNKIRVYLDTSVISYLDQKDMEDRMKETQEVWEILKSNKYEVIISSLAIREISECKDEKKEVLMSYLEEIDYEKYTIDEDTEDLAEMIIEEGILRPKSLDDATHIAAAILSNSSMILSWNFKHLVNYNTINGVRQICFKKHINRIIDIYSPYVLLENDEENNKKKGVDNDG